MFRHEICTAALVAAAFAFTSCAAPPRQPDRSELLHVAVFWLRADAPDDTVEAMTRLYYDKVRHVDGVLDVFAGRPVGNPRDVVDNSFALLTAVRFADAEAEVAWQTHPVHDDLRERFGPRFERVVVYDAGWPDSR